MTFCSFQYFLFLPVLFLIFCCIGEAYRKWLLLAASVLFYGALGVPYLLLALLAVTVITYFSGLLLGRCTDGPARKRLFWLGVAGNLLVLCSLKYASFVSGYLAAFSGLFGLQPARFEIGPVVSIGVSYYVFQAISYLIDIFIDFDPPEQDFGYFALYLSFFPKLLQGPIERAGDLLPQLRVPFEFNYENVRSGLLLFTWGMFKKLVVADRLGIFVDYVYGNVHGYSGTAMVLATYTYAFQLLFDFSGYTDMALGTARIFNISLTQNFNTPYLATSVADFWRRWHISFSRWILDNIFRPLQLLWKDWGSWGAAAALLVTFLVSGIWHGAKWGFIVWGLLHGVYLAASVFYKPWQKRIHKALGLQGSRVLKIWQTVVTFNLVCLSLVFFRADTIADAWYMISHSWPGIITSILQGNFKALLLPRQANNAFLQSLPMLGVILIVFLVKDRINFYARPRWFRLATYYALVYSILYFSVINSKSQFVYFQF
jgi:D-alanyl-lipoteichoic acid acyltransferase DltB (MBOAT superfamily)